MNKSLAGWVPTGKKWLLIHWNATSTVHHFSGVNGRHFFLEHFNYHTPCCAIRILLFCIIRPRQRQMYGRRIWGKAAKINLAWLQQGLELSEMASVGWLVGKLWSILKYHNNDCNYILQIGFALKLDLNIHRMNPSHLRVIVTFGDLMIFHLASTFSYPNCF